MGIPQNENVKELWCKAFFYLGIINFAVFIILAIYLGGDALNGTIDHGHYFLMSHGRYTEVSEMVFNYSKWHARSLMVTHPLALLAGYQYYRIKR